MDLNKELYQERFVTVLDILDQSVEVLKPESLVLKIRNNQASFKNFDIGCLCYSLRRSKSLGQKRSKDGLGKVNEVVLESLESWRISLIASMIEYLRTQVITKSQATVENIAKHCIAFFNFCEQYQDASQRTQTFEGFISIYYDFTEQLRHKVKLAPNNPLSLTRSSAASSQRSVRGYLQCHFKKAEIDIIRYVPSIMRGRDKSSVVPAPDAANRDNFIKFCFSLFRGLSDGIIGNNHAPFKMQLRVRDEIYDHIYLDPKSCADVVINPDLSWPTNEEINKIIEEKKHWTTVDKKQRKNIFQATRQAKKHRHLNKDSSALIKSYVLAQSAFIVCFYAATGVNPIVLTNLKTTSEKPKTLRGMRFSGLKARAKNQTVYPEFGSHFLPIFNKFNKLRSHVISIFGNESLWFFRPHSDIRNLDAEDTITPVKNFIKEHGYDVPIISPTQIRKGLAVDFLKLSRGDLVITSKKLGNSIATVASNYSTNDPKEQSQEFSDFYQKMFESAIERARPIDKLISVKEVSDSDFQTPVGHCANTYNELPSRMEEFNKLAPQPDCSRPETCLFCEHYSVVPDKEDIAKLLGLRELITLVKENVGVSDQYIKIFAPIFHRIDEIIYILKDKYPKTKLIVSDVQDEIEQGTIHPFWDEHYDFLIELSLEK